MKQEVGPSVAVHILDVAGAVRLRAIALCWIVGVSETDGARIDSGGIESVSCEDGDRGETVASEVIGFLVLPGLTSTSTVMTDATSGC